MRIHGSKNFIKANSEIKLYIYIIKQKKLMFISLHWIYFSDINKLWDREKNGR